MPGILPSLAMLRRQMRQIRNFRYTLRGRPHNWQRRWTREENFGGRFARATIALVAMETPCQSSFLNGMPSPASSSRASSSERAEVWIEIFMPWVNVT